MAEPGEEVTTWRYCITREHVDDGSDAYAVREVYTHPDEGLSWSTDPIAPHGETWWEIADDIAKMSRAVSGRVLDLTLDPPALVKPGRFASTGEGGQ